ncbi:MAG: 4Fe-4S binding protein [Armatimonadetes bacterium]|nr:4Fe-4S binding protein [Armatimonadota bacterium]
MSNRITITRRIVQTVCFVLLLYGAFIWPAHLETGLPRIPGGAPRTTLYEKGRILWVSGKESVVDLYIPALACRFVARGGLLKSCIVHFFSENFTWRTSFRLMLPHILALTIMCVLLGRLWCGWVCPMGAMMDAMTWLRRLTGRGRLQVGEDQQRFLFNTRHLLLWGSLAVSVLIAFPVFGQGVNDSLFLIYCQFCPARLLYPPFGGVNPCWSDTTNTISSFLTGVGWAMFALFFLGFAIPRFWCRICAIGALVGYFNRGALLTIEKEPGKCSSCGTCRRNCPVDVTRVYSDRRAGVVTDPECQLCLTCLEDCPEPGALELRLLGRRIVRS